MRPSRLELTNFTTYASATLDIHPGLYVISGANGAGKSSLFDAITYALWGEARSSIKNLARFGERPSEVLLEFEEGDSLYRVIRSITSGGNLQLLTHIPEEDRWESLTGRRMDETQTEIEKLIRFSYPSFLSTSFFKQGKADVFMVGTATDRKKVLEEILQIDQWEKWAKTTRHKQNQLANDTNRVTEILTVLRARLNGLESTKTLQEITEKYERLRAGYSSNELKINDLHKDVTSLTDKLTAVVKERDAQDELSSKGRRLREVNAYEKEKIAKRLLQVQEGTCPVCLGPLNDDVRERVKAEVATWNTAEVAYREWGGDTLLDKLAEQREDFATQIAEIRNQRSYVQKQIEMGESAQKVLQTTLGDLKAEKAKLEAYEQTRSELQTQITAYEDQASQIARDTEDLRILSKAFSRDGIPASLLRKVLPSIEEETNRILDRLSQGRFTVEFKTGGGDKRETLDVNVQDGTFVRPYETFSGGEQYRLNFAIRIALSLVLASIRGANLKFLVIDEGWGSLDEEGKRLLVQCIVDVQDLFDTILIITHLPDVRDALLANGAHHLEIIAGQTGSEIHSV